MNALTSKFLEQIVCDTFNKHKIDKKKLMLEKLLFEKKINVGYDNNYKVELSNFNFNHVLIFNSFSKKR